MKCVDKLFDDDVVGRHLSIAMSPCYWWSSQQSVIHTKLVAFSDTFHGLGISVTFVHMVGSLIASASVM